MGIVRKTKSVDYLLNVFSTNSNAFSVVDLIKQTEAQMNKTTVYRILDRLEAEGIIHSFNDPKGLRWYAKCKDCSHGEHVDMHPHFQCTVCGTIECLPVNVAIPNVPGFQVDNAEMMLVGTCKNCLS
jgi:Fur family ferric uptake transcriptional regulator